MQSQLILVSTTFASLLMVLEVTFGAPYEPQAYLLTSEDLLDEHGHRVQIANIYEEEVDQLGRSADVHVETILHDDEDEEDETTIRGPGVVGILSGLSGIFQGALTGNLGKVVESTFNFVPPVYQGGVQGVFGNLVGRTTTTTTTQAPVKTASPLTASTSSSATAASTADADEDEEEEFK